MFNKIQRGQKGYLSYKKKTESIKTVIYFAIPLSLFIAGIVSTGSKLNLLTIVAVLGMLPACRSLVTLIMYLKSHGISSEDFEKIEDLVVPLTGAYDNVFTTYEATYEVPSVVVRSKNVCGYVSKKYKSLHELEKHLATSIKKEGYSVNVKIFENLEAYLLRLESINKLQDSEPEKDLAILNILFEVSL